MLKVLFTIRLRILVNNPIYTKRVRLTRDIISKYLYLIKNQIYLVTSYLRTIYIKYLFHIVFTDILIIF